MLDRTSMLLLIQEHTIKLYHPQGMYLLDTGNHLTNDEKEK